LKIKNVPLILCQKLPQIEAENPQFLQPIFVAFFVRPPEAPKKGYKNSCKNEDLERKAGLGTITPDSVLDSS
jgi:hypothetical protein